MTLRGGSQRRRRRVGRARQPNWVIRPGFTRDPFERIVSVRSIVAIDMVFSFRAVASPRILVDRCIATTHNLAPATQERSTQGSVWSRQPALGAVSHVLPFG